MADPRETELNEDLESQDLASGGGDDSLISSAGSGSGPAATGESVVGDLLRDREDRVLQWLHALDLQVVGACRADERLKPFLKSTSAGGVAEDRLLAHLNKHFEPSEVGMLARCFCIPLVSVRVGKIEKRGTLFSPSSSRGNLNLMVLPTSDLRLVFVGDDGNTERLFTVGSESYCPAISIEEIPADCTGRSFRIKVSDGKDFYFWCSEKSKLLGTELLAKMKDILKSKPSIAELSGIDKLRLDCFATHLHAYLVGGNARETSTCVFSSSCNSDTSTVALKSLRARHTGNPKRYGDQGSLSPRLSSFKDGQPRSCASLRNATRDKLRRRGDSLLCAVDNLRGAQVGADGAPDSNHTENDKVPGIKNWSLEPPSFLESLGKMTPPPLLDRASRGPFMTSQLFSPHYCWCPQGSSSSQHQLITPDLPISCIESLSLPPLSSLLSATRPSSLLSPSLSLSLSDVPTLDFPSFLPEPLARLPLTSSLPMFTPLMCDPIVHIPVIDVCSSGQGYLVSAGPAIQSSIPPLLPKLVSPLVSETESMVEKGARETLRLLLSSSNHPGSHIMDVLPAVFSNSGEIPSIFAGSSCGLYNGVGDEISSIFAAGRRGLYSGVRDEIPPLFADGSRGLYNGVRDEIPSIFAAGRRGLYSGVRDEIPPLLADGSRGLYNGVRDEIPSIFAAGSRGLYTGVGDVDAMANGIATMGLVSLSGVWDISDGLAVIPEQSETDGPMFSGESLMGKDEGSSVLSAREERKD